MVVALVIFGSFGVGLGISEYRQRAAIIIHFTITSYDEDGTIYATSKSVWVGNRRGEWTETQVLPDGKLHTAKGKVTPRHESLASFPDAPREEILGRTVVVHYGRQADMWYDPSLHQFLKHIIYTDETRQTVNHVIEATQIED